MPEIKERFNPSEIEELDEIIRSSYNDFVRQERRNLLLCSSVTVIAAFSGLKSENFSLLGFTFTNLTESAFYLVLAVLTAYFLVAFLIYSEPHYRDAKRARRRIVSESGSIEYFRPWYSIVPSNIGTDSRYFVWLFVHFILPILAGIIALTTAVTKTV